MTQEEIYKAIENAKWNPDKGPFGKYEYTELLFFYDKNNAYCVHGVRYSDGVIVLVFTSLLPKFKTYRLLEKLPYKEIETMKSIWYSELMEKYGNIHNAMKSIEN